MIILFIIIVIGMVFILRGFIFFVKALTLTKDIAKDKIKEKRERSKFNKNVDRQLEEILNNEHTKDSR